MQVVRAIGGRTIAFNLNWQIVYLSTNQHYVRTSLALALQVTIRIDHRCR